MKIDQIPPLGRTMAMTLKVLLKNLGHQFQLAGIPITVDQHILLKVVHTRGEVFLQELADVLRRDKSQILRQIDVLQGMKLLARIPDQNDKRKKQLVLTAAGADMLKQTTEVEGKTQRILTQGLEPKDVELMLVVMEQIQSNSEI